jgi:hypothetical protein
MILPPLVFPKCNHAKTMIGLLVQTFGAEQNWLLVRHLGSHLGLHLIPSPENPSGHGPHVSDVSDDCDDCDAELFDAMHSTP